MVKKVKLGKINFGDPKKFVLIAGTCVVESEQSALHHAMELKKITKQLQIPFIYKSSYDKANRSSVRSFRGLGQDHALAILKKVKQKLKVPILTDVHAVSEVEAVAEVADVLQIPAFLCRQTDLVVAAGKTGKIVNIKKGQFMAPLDMKNVIDKVRSTGNKKILLTERGTTFGYNNLVTDFRSIPWMQSLKVPVVFDVTHSCQIPGGLGHTSGGYHEFIPLLARCAVAGGADALFFEVHRNPKMAKSDGPNSYKLSKFKELLKQLLELRKVITKKR